MTKPEMIPGSDIAITPVFKVRVRGKVRVWGMSLLALVVLAASVGLPAPARAAGAGEKSLPMASPLFLQAIDDVPLMGGLTEQPVAGVVFETAAGRIVEAEAVSGGGAKLTARRIMGFYTPALAALGWKPLGHGRFAREGEILSIAISTENHRLRVRFSLRPK